MASDRFRMIKDWKDYREQALTMTERGFIPVYGDLYSELEEVVTDCIETAVTKGKKEVTLVINSGGGDNGVFSTIKGVISLSGLKFIGLVISRAQSNAFMILQLCEKRVAVKDSVLMFHWGSTTLRNGELSALILGETWPVEKAVTSELNSAEFVSKRTGVPLEDLKKMALYERVFTASQAKKLNFIDEILDEPPANIVLPTIK